MKIEIGGVHTPTEQEKLARDLKICLAPLVPSIVFRPRPSNGIREKIVMIEGVAHEDIERHKPVIEQRLAMNACFNFRIVRKEDLVDDTVRTIRPAATATALAV